MTPLASYSADEALAELVVVDRTGNGNDIPLTGSGITRAADGWSGNALSNTGPAPAYPPTIGQTDHRTVMAWLRGPMSAAGWPMQWYVSTIDSGAWGILILSGNVHIQARNATTFARASAPAPAFATGWHHVAGSYDGTDIRLYLDGVLKATTSLAGPLRTDGAVQLFGYAENDFIDDIRIYHEALDAAAVTAAMSTPVDTGTGIYAFV